MLSLKYTLWQLAIIVNYLLLFSACVTVRKSCSYLQNSSPEVITLPLDWALLLSIGRSVVSECAYSVNITERVLAWPHQYNMDKRLLAICLSTVPHPSHLSPEKIYSKENWLVVYSDDEMKICVLLATRVSWQWKRTLQLVGLLLLSYLCLDWYCQRH